GRRAVGERDAELHPLALGDGLGVREHDALFVDARREALRQLGDVGEGRGDADRVSHISLLLVVAAATRGRERTGLRGITIAEQLLDAALRVVQAPRAGAGEPDALLEHGERLLERQLSALEALHDLLEARQDLLEARLRAVATRAFFILTDFTGGHAQPPRPRRCRSLAPGV